MKVVCEKQMAEIIQAANQTVRDRVYPTVYNNDSPLRATSDIITALLMTHLTVVNEAQGSPEGAMNALLQALRLAFLLGIFAERDGWYLDIELVEE